MIILYPDYEELYRAPRYSITVNTAAKSMTLFKDGKVFKTYPIAIGKPTDPIPHLHIPKGSFALIAKLPFHYQL